VPGTYKVSHALTTISSFSTAIDVIASKQRPRKLTVLGSDGNNYHFLLKGNEDLRQDERVMQLFGLINACLENDRSTRSRALGIVRYSVLPLSNNSGVIGWVENCDTLNQLIREYRLSKDLKVNIEARLKMSKAPDYDKLTLLQKVDIFRQVQDETTGQDLAKMLWLKSKSSDVWVERRANYTTSLAVMSMVGYILGLGDRHPSNLMLDRISGRIVHIDFGDCFEVSMQRAVLPETVPFRLTRMMITAMEASGIQGTYRFTCNRVWTK
jgi:FKBP12-rapamycin complex-associated protein